MKGVLETEETRAFDRTGIVIGLDVVRLTDVFGLIGVLTVGGVGLAAFAGVIRAVEMRGEIGFVTGRGVMVDLVALFCCAPLALVTTGLVAFVETVFFDIGLDLVGALALVVSSGEIVPSDKHGSSFPIFSIASSNASMAFILSSMRGDAFKGDLERISASNESSTERVVPVGLLSSSITSPSVAARSIPITLTGERASILSTNESSLPLSPAAASGVLWISGSKRGVCFGESFFLATRAAFEGGVIGRLSRIGRFS